MEIHPVAAVAISDSFPSKLLRELKSAIPEGENVGFDLTAKFAGRLTRAEATEANPTASILAEPILAECIRRLGVTRAAFEAALLEVATDALVNGVKVKDLIVDQAPEILGVIHTVKQNVIKQLPKQQRPGAIKVLAAVDLTRCKIA